ncbi:MAG TPA: hypothetical protein VK858_04910 [Longimicrobiales bacterium]|nr:hypothetical protein [Longimicrobiales bacterium]
MRILLPFLAVLALAGPLAAQAPVAPEPQSPFPDSVTVDEGPSPLGAFLRAIALPGWGHASIGSHRRGIFYVAAESGTAWMLWRTASRRSSAREILSLRESVVRAELLASGEVPPEEIDAVVAEDPRVGEAQTLVDARQGQFEDWVAMGIFLTFLSGADAFVSAHLRDFPDPIDVTVGPGPEGGVEVGARLRLGRR